MWNQFYAPHRRAHDPLHNDDCIYTPGVVVFKSDTDYPQLKPEEKWYSVNVLTCAAPNLRERPSNGMNSGDGDDAVHISREELQTLQKYLTETYPGIEIGGGAVVETLEESAFDSLVNEINSQTTDVIVSGLAGTRQDRFVLENSSKISAKIWLSLGEHSTLQNEAGIKTSWWGTLLKKNTFKWMVTKYNSEKDG